jgi:hypothetical protein
MKKYLLKIILPIIDVAWIRKLLNQNSDVINSRFQLYDAMLYHVLQECKAIDDVLHVRNRSKPWTR